MALYLSYTLAVVILATPLPSEAQWCSYDQCDVRNCQCVGSCWEGSVGYSNMNWSFAYDCALFVCVEGSCHAMDGLGGYYDPCYVCCTDYFRWCQDQAWP